MRKRFVSLALVLVLVLSFCACTPENTPTSSADITEHSTDLQTSFEEYEGYDRIDKSLLDFSMDLYTKAELAKGYESLESDAQRECYKFLEQNVFYISQDEEDESYNILPVTLKNTQLHEAELHFVISAFVFDNPQVFWIDSSFSYYTSSSETYLQVASTMSAQAAEDNLKKMHAGLKAMFSGLPGNLSQFDRELYVHDKLIEVCKYADEEQRTDGNINVYTSLGAIVDGVAVCEGYSRATQLMLSLLGIESYCVYGRGNNELHMWNSVNLDGDWYYTDVTWDDKGQDGASYNHFNITTEQLLSDRSILPLYEELSSDEIVGEGSSAVNFNIFIPDCDSDTMSFYSHNSVTVTGFDEENINSIAQAMVDAVNSNKEEIYLYIDPYYLDYEDASNNLFYSGDYAIFTCIDKANTMLSGNAISNEYVTTEEVSQESVIVVYIEY